MMEIIQGDCLDVMAGMEEGSVDAIITDPPYFLPSRHYCTRKAFPRSLVDLGVLEKWFGDWFHQCARVLKPSGVLYIFCDGQSYPIFYAAAYRYVNKLRPLVWDKAVAFNGYTWRHQHELILFAEMEEAVSHKTGDGDILRHRAVPVGERLHPAEKPIPLLEKLITRSVPEGGLVLDPFAGSGGTGLAAASAGRLFLGIEKEPAYAQIARDRIASAGPN